MGISLYLWMWQRIEFEKLAVVGRWMLVVGRVGMWVSRHGKLASHMAKDDSTTPASEGESGRPLSYFRCP